MLQLSSDNFSKETPAKIKIVYRTLMFLSAMWLTAIEPRFTISDSLAHEIDSWMGIGNLGIYFFCQYFGYKQPEGIKGQPQGIAPTSEPANKTA